MFRRVDSAQVECDQQGAGAPLLLIHSLLTEFSVFDGMLPRLAKERRVSRINLPGFGASSPIELATVAAHADHVARAMDALELAIRHGARFGRLIVADTLAAFPEPSRAPFRNMAAKVSAEGMKAVLDTAIGRMFPPAFAERHPDVIAARKTALAKVDAQCFARACLALASLDVTSSASKIKNPTLVMCGALDQTTPPALARKLADNIQGARYEEIAGSGHCPMLEQPEALAQEILGF
ncbi:MAG TPA: alpha/beta fold hydrolase [Burkholderiales bacterium]|nr:alpha/beta fold hydrolase [Burkholderiales bacterium]